MNLLHTLLGFARVVEDPTTEILAWFLEASPPLRAELLRVIDDLLRTRGAGLPRGPDGAFAAAEIATQVVVSDSKGTCRYDLVLDWHAPRVRVVVEVKVWAGLTYTVETDPESEHSSAVDQVTRYLAIADKTAAAIRSHVLVLAPYAVDLPSAAASHPAFAGQLSWQVVHDSFARIAAADALDPTMRTLARDFVHALEIRRMAAPKLTFDALTSVYRYRRFEQSITTMLTHARDALFADGTLAGFHKGDKRAWQDDVHDRLGWRLWLDPAKTEAFAFLGIYVGEDTIHEEVPDLYFFLETRRGTDAQKKLDDAQPAIADALAALQTKTTRWYSYPGGWEAIGATTSLVEIARDDDPTDATTRFFRECVQRLRTSGVLQRYLDAHATR